MNQAPHLYTLYYKIPLSTVAMSCNDGFNDSFICRKVNYFPPPKAYSSLLPESEFRQLFFHNITQYKKVGKILYKIKKYFLTNKHDINFECKLYLLG